MQLFPQFLFHEKHAPEGRLFQTAEDVPTQPGWVDTPEKFDPTYQEPAPVAAEDTEAVGVDAKARGFVAIPYPQHLFRKGDVDHPRRVETAEDHVVLEAAEPGVWKDTYDPTAWDASPAGGASSEDPLAASADAAGEVGLSDEQATALHKQNVATIVTQLEGVSDPALLVALTAAEEANPKGARVSVIKAIKARAGSLAAAAE